MWYARHCNDGESPAAAARGRWTLCPAGQSPLAHSRDEADAAVPGTGAGLGSNRAKPCCTADLAPDRRSDPFGASRSRRIMTLTVIVPATDHPATLPRCLAAIAQADATPEQLVVIDDPAITHPALARNIGARRAAGDVLVFVDADVTVHPDVFVRIRKAFASDQQLVALFGSYDDAPDAPGVVSTFRNLLHHYVHQHAAGPASTFWAGLGAMRRTTFESCGGFTVHPIEDIELGMRLARDGKKIRLDPMI